MPYTLLLADDSVTIQRVIELTFADEDVRVVTVSDGDQAIAAIEQRPPDIVLADVGMPGRDGYEVAQHVKSTPRLAHIPVVLLTGAFEPIDQARATEVGCNGVLAKPFEPQLVIGRVKELLAKRPQPLAAHAMRSAPTPASAPHVDMPRAVPQPPPVAHRAADDYFDRLDEAFANLTGVVPPPGASAAVAPPQPVSAANDWFSAPPPPTPAPKMESPSRPVEPVREPVAQPAAPVTPPAPAAPPPLPPLADAFAAILASEQGSAPHAAPAWPGQPVARPDPGELVDEVTRRVLDQLSDRVVRETVADIVSKVAERLVREEIERIKSTTR